MESLKADRKEFCSVETRAVSTAGHLVGNLVVLKDVKKVERKASLRVDKTADSRVALKAVRRVDHLAPMRVGQRAANSAA
jgi:hypothetical protein